MNKTLKTLARTAVVAGITGLAAALPGKAEAQVSGSAEYIQSERDEASYFRGNFFYGFPDENTEGYTFMELNKDGTYFGKTYVDTSLFGRVGTRAEFQHVGEPLSRVGIGVNTTIPGLPEDAYAKVGLIPLWMEQKENEVNRTMLQYSFGVPLPFGFNLSGFGDTNLSGENGMEWDYGEFNLSRKVGIVDIGYNPALLGDGDAVPGVQHRASIRISF